MENANNDPIGEALNLPTKMDETIKGIFAKANDNSALRDFETARSNILDLIAEATDAASSLMAIAGTSQQPRAYEVYAKLLDTILNYNRELLELQAKIRVISAIESPHTEEATVINNNLFVGSTADLVKLIQNTNSKIIENE